MITDKNGVDDNRLRATASSATIKALLNTQPIDYDWSFVGYKPSETNKWTHGFHRYPAKFIPQLVEKLIADYLPDRVTAQVNDPFMGCGTTIVTAIAKGFKASGTDINKMAHLITRVKSTPIAPDDLQRKIAQFLSQFTSATHSQITLFNDHIEPLIPEKHLDRINYRFSEETKNELGKLLRLIYHESDEITRNFFLVAFSHILKNCSIWHQGSTKPLRDFKKNLISPRQALRKQLLKMQRGNQAFYQVVMPQVRENLGAYLNICHSDARKQPVADGTVDLVVTSSPYVTSYEYADLHQLSTIWLEFADDLTEYKKQFIGTACKSGENKKLQSLIAMEIVEQMSQKSPKMAKEIEAFFMDMSEVFDESFRILRTGGRCCYVIGNTKLKGIEILNAEVFAESLQFSGFKLEQVIKREIPLKILPQKRDEKTGRFATHCKANIEAYPIEYIIIGLKE